MVALNARQVCLEVSETLRAEAWQRAASFTTEATRWRAALNWVCGAVVLPWLREDYGLRAVVQSAEEVWEFVDGVAIAFTVNGVTNGVKRRLILLPIEAIAVDGFQVPQEWVDIPEWAGDYYVPLVVNWDEGWLQVAGFTTHARLKALGQLDLEARLYELDEMALNLEFGGLWVAQELCPAEVTQGAIAPLEALPLAQVENLIARLGEALNPRLQVPFATWAGLMAHGGWRSRLARRRCGLDEGRSLVAWLRSGVAAMGWDRVSFQAAASGARGEGARGEGETEEIVGMARQVTAADQTYELQVFPVDLANNVWRFGLRNWAIGGMVPVGVTLRLLTEDLQGFEGNADRADAVVDGLFVDVALEPGEGVVWEMEPLPEGYEREILRF
jgi:hypothetical protein